MTLVGEMVDVQALQARALASPTDPATSPVVEAECGWFSRKAALGALLTVEYGSTVERPEWHASASAWLAGVGPIPVSAMRPDMREALRGEACALVEGVGAGEVRAWDGDLAIHVSRPLSADELARCPIP